MLIKLIKMILNYFAIPGYTDQSPVELKKILTTVAAHFRIPIERLKLPGRQEHLVTARAIYCYLALKRTKLTLLEIGQALGKDHSTVVHYRTKIENAKFTKDPKVVPHLMQILWKLENQ